MSILDLLQLFVAALDVLAWPIVVLILVRVFREQIRALLLRLEEAWWGDRGAKFRKEDEEAQEALGSIDSELQEPPAEGAIQWSKTGDLFWLGNNLMWIKDMLYRGAPKDYTIDGMRKSLRYLDRLGFGSTYAHEKLQRLVQVAENKPPSGWTVPWRAQLAKEVEPIKQFVASRAEANQPGFVKTHIDLDE